MGKNHGDGKGKVIGETGWKKGERQRQRLALGTSQTQYK